MRKNFLPFFPMIVALIFISYCPQLSGKETPAASPVYLPEESFEFPPVLDGEEVQHGFIILNRGTSPLNLLKVKPDCGCTTVSFPKQISPGGKGTIIIRLKTTAYGGEHVVKTIAVRTDDDKRPDFTLAMMGEVRPLADIKPSEVKLTGDAGRDIKQTVTITPLPENPLRIVEARADKGTDIRLELTEMKKSDARRYRLTVYNLKKEKGWYMDTIFLKTDSSKSPVIKIRVLGMIRAKS